jgi:hypothetical protein
VRGAVEDRNCNLVFIEHNVGDVADKTRQPILRASLCVANGPGELMDSNSCAWGSRLWFDVIPTNVPWTDVVRKW